MISKEALKTGVNYAGIASGAMTVMAIFGSVLYTGRMTFGVILAVYALAYYLLITWIARIKILKSYRNFGDAMCGRWEFEDGEDGLIITSDYFNKKFIWKSFSRVILGKKYLIIQLGGMAYFHIPIDDDNKNLMPEFYKAILSKI